MDDHIKYLRINKLNLRLGCEEAKFQLDSPKTLGGNKKKLKRRKNSNNNVKKRCMQYFQTSSSQQH